MIRNYLKTAFRNFLKKKVNSFVVVTGLVISLAFCLLMFLYIEGALGWDRDHPESDRLHLLTMDYFFEDDVPTEYSLFDFSKKQMARYSSVSYVHARDLQANLPEFKESTLIYNLGYRGESDILVNGNVFKETVTSADANFFDYFSHKVLLGDPSSVILDQKSVVISSEVARKYFEGKDVLDQTISVVFDNEQSSFKVAAVVELPAKSSVRFDILMGFESNKDITKNLYELQSNAVFKLFVRPSEGVEKTALASKVNIYFKEKFKDYVENRRRFSELREDSPIFNWSLTAAKDMHLDPLLWWDNKADVQQILLVGIFAIVLIILSAVNFFLISMAVLSARVSEISVRRVTGAKWKHILTQFWLENSLLILFSLILGACCLQFFLPYLSGQLGIELKAGGFILIKGIAFLGLILIMASLFISIYPSQIISRLKLSKTLKGHSTYKINTRFVNALIVVQFMICFGFITGGLAMNEQMNFALNRDMGFDQELVVKVSAREAKFKDALMPYPEIEKVGRGGAWQFGHGSMNFIDKINDQDVSIVQLDAERDLLELLGLEIDWQSQEFSAKPVAIVNSPLADLIGREKLFESKVGFGQSIVGEVTNTELLPLTSDDRYFFITPNAEERRLRQTFIKVAPGQLQAGLARIEDVWYQLYPNRHFTYEFLDEYIARNYDSFQATTNLINFITLLGIVIAGLGLFALNGITTQNRIKEIGIRKVLGASVNHIMYLLNLRVFIIILIAALLSMPLSYKFLSGWLENFSDHIYLNWTYFTYTFLIGLVLSAIIVSVHTMRSVRLNPVDLLKEE